MKLFIVMTDGEMFVKAFTPELHITHTEELLVICNWNSGYTETYRLDEISTLLILK